MSTASRGHQFVDCSYRTGSGRTAERTNPATGVGRAIIVHASAGDVNDAVETAQTGMTMRMSTQFDVPGTIENINFFAGAARNLQGAAAGNPTSRLRREAIGVVGSIAPRN